MKRSTLVLSFGFVFVVLSAAVSCSDSGGNGTTGTAGTTGHGGTTGTAGNGTTGTAGTTGAAGTSAAGTSGSAGTTGTAGSGTAGTGGSGTAGAAGSGTAGAAGTAGVTGTAGGGGRGGNGGVGAGGRGGSNIVGDAGVSGTAGRGGSGGATGGSGGRGGTAGGSGGATGGLTLTSTAFTNGTMIPAAQTCTGSSHMSPPLTWTAGPSGTMSYGVALVDMSNGFVHWVIWDIPATTTMLPGNLPKTQMLTTPVMAQQINRFTGDGYFGPCPSGSTHTYVFEVYALDVATLPGVSITGMPEAVRTTMMAHDLASGTLSGTSNASM